LLPKRCLQTGKADIDWEDPEGRQRELKQLVEDAELALKELPAKTNKPVASTARKLPQQVAHQDVERGRREPGPDSQGVAKDRVVSTVDPQMRNGHKSATARRDGFKKHVSVEPETETELITAVEESAANVNDGATVMKLLEQPAELGVARAEVAARPAVRPRKLREQTRALGEGTTIVTKAAALPDSGYFHKSEFEIDLEAGTVTPATTA